VARGGGASSGYLQEHVSRRCLRIHYTAVYRKHAAPAPYRDALVERHRERTFEIGAGGGIRTRMPFRTGDFKSVFRYFAELRCIALRSVNPFVSVDYWRCGILCNTLYYPYFWFATVA
jgi:hypothetical protein